MKKALLLVLIAVMLLAFTGCKRRPEEPPVVEEVTPEPIPEPVTDEVVDEAADETAEPATP